MRRLRRWTHLTPSCLVDLTAFEVEERVRVEMTASEGEVEVVEEAW